MTATPHTKRPPNRLAGEASSYLRSAAEQPVQWYPWGAEAFERAKREDKPILLDIGAVWCHWCHVMDGESYEDEAVAHLINDRFVPIKVDRDERPDVDARYQPAIAALSGGGGWPLTAFLTPEGEVFSGGTYFPPKDLYGRPGFPRVLKAVSEAYTNNKGKMVDQARDIQAALSRAGEGRTAPGKVSWGPVKKVLDAALMNFDFRHGGFGEAPKFPHTSAVELALTELAQTGDEALNTVVEVTLTKMAQGGVADQIGGGFHRYSTDEKWIVPHFEKMLYDNAELLRNYAHGYQVTRNEFFAEVARGTVGYLNRALSDQARGGFFASQDADIGTGDDGDFWTWTNAELDQALGKGTTLSQVMAAYFDVSPHGEMHHNASKNVLWVAADWEELARHFKIGEKEAQAMVADGKRRMLQAREARTAPFVDRTIYTSWNALAVSAYVEVWRALRDTQSLEFAKKTADFLLRECWHPERGMAHQWSAEGKARVWGLLDDQAFFAMALLDLYSATQESKYLDAARGLADLLLGAFRDSDGTMMDAAPSLRGDIEAKPLSQKVKPMQDTPTPSGNAISAMVFDRLEALTADAKYRDGAAQLLGAFAGSVGRYGIFAATMACAMRLHLERPLHVTIAGSKQSKEAKALFDAAIHSYSPHAAVVWVEPDAPLPSGLPDSSRDFVASFPREKLPAASVCRGTVCNLPTSDPAELSKQVSSKVERPEPRAS